MSKNDVIGGGRGRADHGGGKPLHLLQLRAHLQQQQIDANRLIGRHAFAHLAWRADQAGAQAAVGDGVFLQLQLPLQLGARQPLVEVGEAGGGGVATALCSGQKFTKAGAAYINAEMIFAGGKWDTFRMLTHPGVAILPVALAAAEVTGCDGKTFLTAIAAAYEVLERMASEFIPTLMSRGFHAGPVFGLFGAAVAAAKIHGLNEDQINTAIAQCVNLAAGNLEGARAGGASLREGGAVRSALLAVALARHGGRAGDSTLEGEAGF